MGLKFRIYLKEDELVELGAASSVESLVELVIYLHREEGYQPSEMTVVTESD